jgi:hypothetical protein
VSVSRGEVTLDGTVPDRWEKRLAEDLTEGVFGVTEVHNRLRTSAGVTSQPERGPTHEPPRPMSTSTGSSGWPASSAPATGSRVAQLRDGMHVVGLDGEQVGRVKEVRGEEFLIDRPMGRGVFVPTRFVQSTVNDQVVLTVPAHQVDGMGWRSPELAS